MLSSLNIGFASSRNLSQTSENSSYFKSKEYNIQPVPLFTLKIIVVEQSVFGPGFIGVGFFGYGSNIGHGFPYVSIISRKDQEDILSSG